METPLDDDHDDDQSRTTLNRHDNNDKNNNNDHDHQHDNPTGYSMSGNKFVAQDWNDRNTSRTTTLNRHDNNNNNNNNDLLSPRSVATDAEIREEASTILDVGGPSHNGGSRGRPSFPGRSPKSSLVAGPETVENDDDDEGTPEVRQDRRSLRKKRNDKQNNNNNNNNNKNKNKKESKKSNKKNNSKNKNNNKSKESFASKFKKAVLNPVRKTARQVESQRIDDQVLHSI